MRWWLGVAFVFALGVIAASALGSQFRRPEPSATPSPFLPSPLDTQVFGQTRWLAGSSVALKVVTMDRLRQQPITAAVHLLLRSERHTQAITARTNANGVADVQLRAPAQSGSYTLQVTVRSPVGDDRIEVPIVVEEAGQILLTTDKPIYQPGQTIHIRALCLRKPDLQSIAAARCVFEVRDPKGNLVSRATEQTSRFGIAAAEFPIADEVTLGEYRIVATLQNPAPNPQHTAPLAVAEKTVRVERYVLPKFKVTVETEKRFYLPAEILRGTVTAAYFFGKPVSGGEVVVRLSTFAAGWHDIAELKGTLNEQGVWQFETRLPEKFVGLPLEGGNALLRVEATVTDKAEHSERTAITLPVSSQPIKVAIIPESAALKPNLPMRLFVVTTYPDGTPAPSCRFTVTGRLAGDTQTQFRVSGVTDAMGLGEAVVTLKALPQPKGGRRIGGFVAPPPFVRRPAPAAPMPMGEEEPSIFLEVTVTVADEKGNRAELRRPLMMSAFDEAVLLRPNKFVAKVGETLYLDIVASSPNPNSRAPVFVDAIVNRQTVLTRTVELQKGHGGLLLPLTPELAGTLTLHAYRITAGGDIVRDTKVVIVEPANALTVKVSADKETYRPGESAQVRFSVTDEKGKPTVAALGITVVDESVFALTEMHPGLERLYFALERELLTPRYEVHGWELQPVLLRRDGGRGTE